LGRKSGNSPKCRCSNGLRRSKDLSSPRGGCTECAHLCESARTPPNPRSGKDLRPCPLFRTHSAQMACQCADPAHYPAAWPRGANSLLGLANARSDRGANSLLGLANARSAEPLPPGPIPTPPPWVPRNTVRLPSVMFTDFLDPDGLVLIPAILALSSRVGKCMRFVRYGNPWDDCRYRSRYDICRKDTGSGGAWWSGGRSGSSSCPPDGTGWEQGQWESGLRPPPALSHRIPLFLPCLSP